MYGESAKVYDLIYSWKDYRKESQKLLKLIRKYKKSKGKELLEVACGTGTHLQYLITKFNCTGLDYSKGMLDEAKRKLKGIRFIQANMINFNLDRQYDIVTCLFSAIGHVKTYENLDKTINNFAKHLKKGGVVIIEPWFTDKTYKGDGSPYMHTYDGRDIKIARLNVSFKKNRMSIMDMHYLIAERGKGVRHYVEKLELGLFEIDKTLELMKRAGFDARFLKNGLMKDRGLYIGIKK